MDKTGTAPVADLETLDQVERWLKEPERTRAQIVIFAARAALRAVPALAGELDSIEDGGKKRAALILPVFRAMAAPWVARVYPTQGAERFAHAAAAARAAATDATAAAHATAHATYAAARAAATDATDATTAAAHAAAAARAAATDAAAAAATDATTAAAHATDATTAAAIKDANRLAHGTAPDELAREPLWHGTAPPWARDLWSRLRAELDQADEDWDVWIAWYERRLAGAPLGLPLERAWLQLTDDDWNQGPAHANRKLKDIVARHTPPPQQRPGMQWVERGDKIVAVSEADESDRAAADRPIVTQMHAAVQQKAKNCASLLNSIDESLGWSGFDEAFSLFQSAIEGETSQVAGRVGTLYSATISLGTFLEFDNDLRQRPQDFKNVQPLDPTNAESSSISSARPRRGCASSPLPLRSTMKPASC